MFKKIVSLTLTVCMLLCFAACGENEESNSESKKSQRASNYEEAVKMYFDAVFNPSFDSNAIKYLAPGDFWSNNLGNTSLDGVIKAHEERNSVYMDDAFDNTNLGYHYSLETKGPNSSQQIAVLTPDSNLDGDFDYADNVEWLEKEYKIELDKNSTIYWLDNIEVDLYEGGETGKYFDTETLDIIVFRVDGSWYSTIGLDYIKELIELARYYDYG